MLEALDLEDDVAYLSDRSNGEMRRSQKSELYQRQLHNLRVRLAPILSLEDSLSANLAGPSLVSSSRGPLVRAGWQFALNTTDDILDDRDPYRQPGMSDEEYMAKMFQASAENIADLWYHPTIRALVKRRRLRLEDSKELYESFIC